ncbi:MAG: hypothetical protein HYY45_12010 [Deltaproteobacteria bacterium]|nr:hypothetical protein [Deltaproteobacteria bacterium]
MTFGGIVGGTQALADLDVTAATINLNSTGVTVDDGAGGATATFTGAVVLGANVTIDTDGAADNSLTFTSTIDATTAGTEGLTITAGGGTVTLGGAVGTTMALDALDVTADTINANGNITTADGNVTLDSTSALTIGVNISAGAGTVTLVSDGAINQTGGAITADKLSLESGSPITVNQAGNDVNTVAAKADTAGDIKIRDTDDMTIGTVGSLSGISSNGGNVTVQTGGNLTVSQAVNAGAGTVTLNVTSGSINGAGLITASTADLDATTGIGNTTALELAASTITADTTNGNIDIDNALGTAVSVNSLTTGTGTITFEQSGGGAVTFVNVTTTSGDITLQNAGANLKAQTVTAGTAAPGDGDLTLETTGSGDIIVDDVKAENDTVTITAAGAILENPDAGVDITGSTLDLTASNGIGTQSEPLEISESTLTATTTNGDVVLQTISGDMTVNQVEATNGGIFLTSAGGIMAGNFDPNLTAGTNSELKANGGSIGSDANPFAYNVSGGGFTVSASGDAFLEGSPAPTDGGVTGILDFQGSIGGTKGLLILGVFGSTVSETGGPATTTGRLISLAEEAIVTEEPKEIELEEELKRRLGIGG